ncbi:MAG: hypothetical protein J6P72_08580 [Firmicutes bacterium]|nr:hypothetical protein [Bacillota bacterium]
MDRAIRISIRDVDIVTQDNRQQFLVIMLEADPSGVNTAVDRIFKSYFRMSGSNVFSPSCSIVGTGKHKIELTDGHNKTEKKGDKGNVTITTGEMRGSDSE